MKSKYKQLSAFTLTEMMVVVLIISVMAAFAVPNYTRTVERAHSKDAATELTTIWAANQVYKAQNGKYWPTTGQRPPVAGDPDITQINTNLHLSIVANGMTYLCGGDAAGANFTCTASRTYQSTTYTLTVDQNPITAPPVTTTSNPKCASCP